MSKRQLIDDIRQLNLTASVTFLAQFDDAALKQYLDHLKAAQENRIHIAGWVRQRSELKKVS